MLCTGSGNVLFNVFLDISFDGGSSLLRGTLKIFTEQKNFATYWMSSTVYGWITKTFLGNLIVMETLRTTRRQLYVA